MNLKEIERLISADVEAMETLRAAQRLGLPDWWLGTGFVRNRVWDHLTPRLAGVASPCLDFSSDVDLVYFDKQDLRPERDWELEERARAEIADARWEIRNQARMHLRNGDEPYRDSLDAIARWPETATCVACTLVGATVRVVACHGIADLVNMVVRPTPSFDNGIGRELIASRMRSKGWLERWPTLRLA